MEEGPGGGVRIRQPHVDLCKKDHKRPEFLCLLCLVRGHAPPKLQCVQIIRGVVSSKFKRL